MKKKDIKYIVVIFLFALLFFIFGNGYFMGDDSLFHTSSIMADASLKSIFPSKIMPIVIRGLGYGINIFYPPVPHLVASYLYRIFGNISVIMVIMQFFSIFLAGFSMYFYIRIVFKNRKQALLSSLFYMSMPYFFTDVFARVAFNESFLFFLIPIIFLSFHYLMVEKFNKFYFCFILGFSLAIYTHLVLSVYLAVVSLLYLLFFYKTVFVKKKIWALVRASVFVLGVTMPFWELLVEHYMLKDYYIFGINYTNDNLIQTYKVLFFIFPIVILSGARNPLRFYILPVAIIYLFFLVIYFFINGFNIKGEHKKILVYFSGVFIVCILFESIQYLWNFVPNLFRNIQFSWRLCLFSSFCVSVVSGYGIRLWGNKFRKIFLILTIFILSGCNIYYVRDLNRYRRDVRYMDDGCCDVVDWKREYLSKEAYKDMSFLAIRSNKIIGKNDEVIRVIDDDEFPNLRFSISDVNDDSEIEFPRLYYLGYVLRDGNGKAIDVYKSTNGLVSAKIKKDGIYTLKYEGTYIFKISIIVSFFCFGGSFWCCMKNKLCKVFK